MKNIRKQIISEFAMQNGELYSKMNEVSRKHLLTRENIDFLSKAITHFAFRNGPVEDMHADGKLSQADMKTLNKYMVSRLAGLLSAIFNNDWLKLELLLTFYRIYGTDWDPIVPENDEIEFAFKMFCKQIRGGGVTKLSLI